MHANGHHHAPLPPPTEAATRSYLEQVVEALGDTPETVIALEFLREGSCEVLCVGDPADLEGLVIQSQEMPTEPIAFGTSAEAIASLLPHLAGWSCINVPADLAGDLLEPVAAVAGASGMRLLDDIYHELRAPVARTVSEGVRLLTSDDQHMIANAPPELVGDGLDRLIGTLHRGHVAGAIRGETLVALAYTFATSDKHADIGVATHPDWQRQGLATDVAATVAMAIQADNRVPVWSCGGTNLASLRTAARLGFVEVSRRIYLIPEYEEGQDLVE
jgi:hypothetical protein